MESQLVRSYSFGFTLKDSSGKEHPSPQSWSRGVTMQNFTYYFSKRTIPTQFSTAGLEQGMAFYPQPPQNDPPKLLLQT